MGRLTRNLTHQLDLQGGVEPLKARIHADYLIRNISVFGREFEALEYIPGTEIVEIFSDGVLMSRNEGFEEHPKIRNAVNLSQNCHEFSFRRQLGEDYWFDGFALSDVLSDSSFFVEFPKEDASHYLLIKSGGIVHSGKIEKGKYLSKEGCRDITELDDVEDSPYDFDDVKYIGLAEDRS